MINVSSFWLACNAQAARVKNAVRMRVFPASGENLLLKLYAITKQTRFRLRNSKNTNTKFINCFSFSLLHHILSSLYQRRKSCLKVHARFRFILKSNINTENGDARICLNERLSCTIAANVLEILAPVLTWRFDVSCFEVLDANKVRF